MIENIHNNHQVLKHIDWESIRDILSAHSHFDQTIDSILKAIQADKLAAHYSRMQNFTKTAAKEPLPEIMAKLCQLSASTDYNLLLSTIKKHQARSLREINQLALCVELYFEYASCFDEFELLSWSKQELQNFKRTIKKEFLTYFRKFVMKDGTVAFEKHPDLSILYAEQISTEQSIRSKLSEILTSEQIQTRLQFSSFDVVNDHYVIPLKSDSFQSKIGRIISRSESGQTLFVEPFQIRDLNLKRLDIIINIQAIISRIELELTESIANNLSFFEAICFAISELDILNTRNSFAQSLQLTIPTISKTRKIDVKDFFHPLIENPVKNDLLLRENQQGIIISGPNTGGKTATLKSMGILQIFLKFGLSLPCLEAEIFPYQSIYYFGHDSQQLEMGLSSFSAEVSQYIQLFEQLEASNLILIDEIFNSTSSEEASALALAIFDYLKDKNCHIIVSTHHQTLKTLMHQNDEFISSHVGFDLATNQPTYKIHYGSPGSSYALNIFQEMTKNKKLYTDALNFLDNKAIHYEKLLESISQKENELNKLVSQNNELNLQLKNQKDSMQGVIKLKIDEKVKKAESKIDQILSDAFDVVKAAKNNEITKEKAIYKKSAEFKSAIKKESPFVQNMDDVARPNLYDPAEHLEGHQYFSTLLNKTVLLKKLYPKRKEALVAIGTMSIKSPLTKLKVANKQSKPKQQTSSVHVEISKEVQLEYDCRGMRLEEFENIVESNISHLLVGNIPFLNIIHGHGDGVLKGWLKKYIKNHKDIKADSTNDGNDGSTRIVLS